MRVCSTSTEMYKTSFSEVTFRLKAGLQPEGNLARERLIHLGTAKKTPLTMQLTFSLNFIETI